MHILQLLQMILKHLNATITKIINKINGNVMLLFTEADQLDKCRHEFFHLLYILLFISHIYDHDFLFTRPTFLNQSQITVLR